MSTYKNNLLKFCVTSIIACYTVFSEAKALVEFNQIKINSCNEKKCIEFSANKANSGQVTQLLAFSKNHLNFYLKANELENQKSLKQFSLDGVSGYYNIKNNLLVIKLNKKTDYVFNLNDLSYEVYYEN